MVIKYNPFSLFLLISLIAYLGSHTSHANAKDTLNPKPNQQAEDITIKGGQTNHSLKQEPSQEISANNIAIKGLETLISNQEHTIKNLEKRIEQLSTLPKNNGMNFEEWMGFLLAAVALILTGLSVGIGLFSFIGYKEVKKKTTETATATAIEIASKTALNVAEDSARIEFDKLINTSNNKGELYTIINEIVQKIIYKDVMLDPELIKNDLNENDET